MDRLSEEEKKAIEKLSSKKNETTWYDTIRQIKREEITDVVVTRQKYITIILNLIEKQNKIIETNKKNWILAQNEVLGYAQGYEDGKQHKQTATEMVVENRKYQIIGEEIKRYKAIIEKQQKELDKKDKTMIKMARVIKSGGRLYGVRSSQGVIEYFTKQVEGEKDV